MPLLSDDFQPAMGLRHGHLQTVFAAVARRPGDLALRRVRLDTPDGDVVDVDWLDGRPGAPTVLVLHGLESSSRAGYVRQLLTVLAARGWSAAALNFRGCSGSPHRQAASYSAGDVRDARWLLSRISGPRAAVGFSLGGSVLLNLLVAEAASAGLFAAACVSAPYELAACARFLDSGRGVAPLYLRHFLPTLKAKALVKATQFPALLDAQAIRAARGMRDFDHAVTARLFGFESAEDYYSRCSAGPRLAQVATPTLLLSAEDDPLAPASLMPRTTLGNDALHVLRTAAGGHVGFVAGSALRPRFWAEARVVDWLVQRWREG
jgi:predicted alpha/beta-fold hydrolase